MCHWRVFYTALPCPAPHCVFPVAVAQVEWMLDELIMVAESEPVSLLL